MKDGGRFSPTALSADSGCGCFCDRPLDVTYAVNEIVARIRDLERAEQIVEPERGHRVSQLD